MLTPCARSWSTIPCSAAVLFPTYVGEEPYCSVSHELPVSTSSHQVAVDGSGAPAVAAAAAARLKLSAAAFQP